MLKITIVILLLLTVGCASREGGLLPGQKFDQNRPISISPIRDVTDTDGAVASNSGASLEAALRERLKKDGYKLGFGGYTLKVIGTVFQRPERDIGRHTSTVAQLAEFVAP